MKVFSIAALALMLVVGAAFAQTSNSAGDATNAQQNGENKQTNTGGQAGGATDRQ